MSFPTSYVKAATISVEDLIYHWVSQQVSSEALDWLNDKRSQISSGMAAQIFFTAFSSVPRYTGKNNIEPTIEELELASNLCSNWSPVNWTVDQCARILLVLSLPSNNIDEYLQRLDKVFAAADVRELVTLYQALPLLPLPEKLQIRASEGIRSNMTAVFNAVALQNPYPRKYLNELAWNQMVLKALFVGSPLHLIQGLDERANPKLARMLVDYAHERWAARRDVSPQLWRCVGKFASSTILMDLERLLQFHSLNTSSSIFSNVKVKTGELSFSIQTQEEERKKKSMEKAAAALACAECPLPQGKAILAQYPQLQADIQAGRLTWNDIR